MHIDIEGRSGDLLLFSFDRPLTERCIPLIINRQNHHVVSEIAVLGTKSGVAPYRNHHLASSTCLHSVVYYFILLDIFLLSSCDVKKCGKTELPAVYTSQRRHQAERTYAQVHHLLCYGRDASTLVLQRGVGGKCSGMCTMNLLAL